MKLPCFADRCAPQGARIHWAAFPAFPLRFAQGPCRAIFALPPRGVSSQTWFCTKPITESANKRSPAAINSHLQRPRPTAPDAIVVKKSTSLMPNTRSSQGLIAYGFAPGNQREGGGPVNKRCDCAQNGCDDARAEQRPSHVGHIHLCLTHSAGPRRGGLLRRRRMDRAWPAGRCRWRRRRQ